MTLRPGFLAILRSNESTSSLGPEAIPREHIVWEIPLRSVFKVSRPLRPLLLYVVGRDRQFAWLVQYEVGNDQPSMKPERQISTIRPFIIVLVSRSLGLDWPKGRSPFRST